MVMGAPGRGDWDGRSGHGQWVLPEYNAAVMGLDPNISRRTVLRGTAGSGAFHRRAFLRSAWAAGAAASLPSAYARAAVSAASARSASSSGLPTPTHAQLRWQEAELGMFFHFDLEVFTRATGRHWQPGQQIPASIFDPTRLDTDQWLAVARSLGARYAVFTAKHNTGFLMWPSDAYPYGVKQAPWRHGRGDVVGSFIASCHRAGIAPGLYCSGGTNAYLGETAWRFPGAAAAARAHRLALIEQIYRELWSRYGPLAYMYFDGGLLPPSQGGPHLLPLLRRWQPNMVCFQGPPGAPGGLARWIGDESGFAPDPCWCTTASDDANAEPGAGNASGRYWIPAEADVPLRFHHWMWRPDDAQDILSLSALTEMYFATVGRGTNLILNANIGPDGRVPAPDAHRFAQFGARLRHWFAAPLAAGAGHGAVTTVRLPAPHPVNCILIEEDLAFGQRVRAYVLEGHVAGEWQPLEQGHSIGRKRLQRIPELPLSAVRLRAQRAVAPPVIRRLAAYHLPAW